MLQAPQNLFPAHERDRVRKAMSHRPVFKLDQAMPDDLTDKLLRLDIAFRLKDATGTRD